jgi:tetratricopeptide (TPR) repeat protein
VRARCAAVAALALWLASATGCATTGGGKRAERELAQKRANSHYDLGVDHLENGRLALALREFMNAEQFRPDDPQIQYALGEAYMRQGKLADSERHLLRALALADDYHDARLLLSTLYVHQERYEEAIREAAILVEDPTFPGPWRALTNQGWAELQLGRNADARRHLELARDYNDRHWPTLLDLGILELKEGHRLEAIELFRKTLELRPGPRAEAEVNYRLGEIYVSLGKRDRAIGHLMAAVAQAPDGQWGKKSEEYLKLLR